MDEKMCGKCGKILPLTSEYFFKRSDSQDGFRKRCKVCEGSKYTTIPKDGYRYCSMCKKELPLTEEYFYPNKAIKTGFRSECRECTKKYIDVNRDKINASARIYYSRNKEEILQRARIYYKDNIDKIVAYRERTKEIRKSKRIENKEKIASAKKIYYKENKEKILVRQKNYNDKNKDKRDLYFAKYRKENKYKLREVTANWRKNNPEKNRIILQRRRTRIYNTICDFTPKQWEECLEYFDYKDAYTGLPMEIISQDHVIPLSKGGNYTKTNIVPCEININCSKNNSDFLEWYVKQPFYSEERKNKILKYIGGK